MRSSYRAKIIPNESWEQIAEKAHEVSFGEKRNFSINRHHFVVGGYVNDSLIGWFTCLEMDSETCYIQYGGGFPWAQKTIHVVCAYNQMINFLKEKYKRAWTRIENTNRAMIKMALQVGFLITGTFAHNNKLFLELTNTFNVENTEQSNG